MRSKFTLFGLLALVVALVPAGAALAQESTGKVSVVHGVPGEGDFPVDVYVNGEATLQGFTFGSVEGPLELPAADYEIEVYAAGADAAASDPALAATVTLPAGADATIVAYLDADGNPTLGTFVNDISATAAGNGRATVRHTAQAPNVDVLAAGSAVLSDVANGAEGVLDVPAGTYPVQVVPAGATEPVVFETDLVVTEGQNIIVYAIGSLDGGSFTVATQTITGLSTPPSGVPSGTGGLAADGGLPVWLVAAVGLGLLAVTGSSVALARSRR